jgi:mannose-6-phosphate isomerase
LAEFWKDLPADMHPLIFSPLYRTYLWGGRRFATRLGRELPEGETFAESWELVDHGHDQSVVRAGPLAGTPLQTLVRENGPQLMGRHAGLEAFPLLFKFLDAKLDLSVQVHPDDARAAQLTPPDRGKTEAWYVVDAEPGSQIYAGVRDGVTTDDLRQAITAGTLERCLHAFTAKAGDCVFIPAGTVHAIGGGLVIAEIQQSSDVTYRLYDWNRVGPDGKPRELHIDAGLEAVTQFCPVSPRRARGTTAPSGFPLVSCEYFGLDLFTAGMDREPAWHLGGDDSPHFLAVLQGSLALPTEWGLPALQAGDCVLLPASIGSQSLTGVQDTEFLHVSLP